MAIRLAVFDMAGTTVMDKDFVAKAFQKALADYGVNVSAADINPLMGYHKPLAIQLMLEKAGVDPEASLVEDIHTEFENSMIGFYENDKAVRPMPGAEEIFLALKEKGIRVALNTGFSKNIADTIVNRFEWKDKGLVDDYIASNEVELGRPYTYMMQELMKRAGISDGSEVAKIGDTTVDMEEGKNAGCKYVVAVTTGAGSREELEETQPTHIINHLSEIGTILQ